MSAIPHGSTSVMARRLEAPDSLDFFPTPPWATRALLRYVIPEAAGRVWEPACGEGHMSQALAPHFGSVRESDVFDYGIGAEIGSFVGTGMDVLPSRGEDWIITNPPFRLAVEFAERATALAQRGVALLVRTAWLEGGDRYRRLFDPFPPTIVAQFAERVPMVKGRWDPAASTATSYAWVVWMTGRGGPPRFMWVPPGCRQSLSFPDDVERFARGA